MQTSMLTVCKHTCLHHSSLSIIIIIVNIWWNVNTHHILMLEASECTCMQCEIMIADCNSWNTDYTVGNHYFKHQGSPRQPLGTPIFKPCKGPKFEENDLPVIRSLVTCLTIPIGLNTYIFYLPLSPAIVDSVLVTSATVFVCYLTRWQHPAVGHGARFAVSGITCLLSFLSELIHVASCT